MELNNVKDGLPVADGAPVTVDVLIAGAGPTGLALGIDLARRGVRALIVERQDRLSPGARGTGLQPRTLEVYDDLGVLDAIRAVGGLYPDTAIWDDGRIVETHAMIERREPTPAAPYADPWMVPQFRNLELLRERLAEVGGDDVLFGAELTEFTQDSDGVTAQLRLSGGPSGGEVRSVRARYLVAADGGRSTVRRALGVGMSGPSLDPDAAPTTPDVTPTTPTTPGVTPAMSTTPGVTSIDPGAALIADVRVDGLDRDHWHRWQQSSGGPVMILPLAGTDYFQAIIAMFSETPDTAPEFVRTAIAQHTHLTVDQIGEVLWASVFRPRAGMADSFRIGRVFLAGDAAHIHTPAGGQGLNTSVQDAYNLGWKLGQVLRYGAPDALLDSYEAERRPIAHRILDTSTRLYRSRSMRRGRDLHQLDIGYPDSPLTRELRTDDLPEDALRAGDRAPDAPCHTADGKPTRLFDIFRGPHFTVLVLGDTDADTDADIDAGTNASLDDMVLPADPDLLRLVRVGGPSPDLIDTDGHIRDAYGTGPAVLVIRPDGYVALAAPATGAVKQVRAALATYVGTPDVSPRGE
ncbi:FAD-dependent monooxygenase [Streptomyces sp. NPDC001339]|uniref:FAD-dependent monooxygenase n=1 Tax=Streptomyces sp. NPDC001339 TaxID=3364563 RepID=UPI0036A1AB92